ncbi:MAG: hypothetical protein EOO15_11845 [Chitinophagaceae bacterium]|nr:MAG: hypothetical protein EOO15_11845 [Chitinophagaceae bacterium]
MGKNSETGHAVNYGKLVKTVTIVEGLGPVFQPVHELIQANNLKNYQLQCKTALDGVKAAEDAFDRAVNLRRDLFGDLKKLSTRIMNAYEDAGASAADVDDLRGVNRKLQGYRPLPAKDPGQDEAGKKQYSIAQLSFINQADNFANIVTRVSAFAGYRPAEADLLPAALEERHRQLGLATDAVDAAASALQQAREARNRLFYDADLGMSARRKRLGNYFKSRKDGSNPLKGISFRNFVR